MTQPIHKGKQTFVIGTNPNDGLDIEHKFSGYGLNKVPQPHEWKLIYKFYRGVLIKKPEIVYLFLAFCATYYPNYQFSIPEYSLGSVVVEADLCNMLFLQKFKYNIDVNLNKSYAFGEIVTEFMIRYLGYSLIGFSEQNIILTAQNNCDKRFQEYLERDFYTIFKLARVKYENGLFQKLPVLPTKDSHLKFDEYIEDESGHKHLVLR